MASLIANCVDPDEMASHLSLHYLLMSEFWDTGPIAK